MKHAYELELDVKKDFEPEWHFKFHIETDDLIPKANVKLYFRDSIYRLVDAGLDKLFEEERFS